MISTPIEELRKRYNMLNDLKIANRNTNKITLDYSKLDSKSVGALKQAISKTINDSFESKEYELTDFDKTYLKEILKQNTGILKVTIDYNKIETYQLRFSLKGQIQEVLKNCESDTYHDILLLNNLH